MKSHINQNQISIFKTEEPLASRIRPKSVNEIIGQEHLLGESGVLTNYFKNHISYSIVLWGPPGVGKTSIAFLAKESSGKEFIFLSGASTSVSELRDAINKGKSIGGKLILFIDEIHRLARNQQDVLLEPVETGQIILIGTTTENPHVSITRALHSRIKVIELKPHAEKDLMKLIERALNDKNGFPDYKITDEAKKLLVISSSGDARRLLFNLEQSAKLSANLLITEEVVKIILKDTQLQLGADPESYCHCVSALQKSLRGSDVSASLYWLSRLLSGGADPVHVARRILVTASEDIGLADNNALAVALNAYQSAQFLGMPEARIPLAQAVIYLASAPKSNTVIVSVDKAMKDAQELPPYSIPVHIRNLGGEGYKYPHSYKDAKVEQEYLPKELLHRKYFEPNERDKL